MIQVLALLRTRTGQAVVIAAIFVIGFLIWLAFHDKKVVQQHEDKKEAQAAPARAKADEQRGRDTATIETQSKEVKDALAPLPPARTSYAQCVRARTIWMQQHPTARAPEPCRPDAGE